MKERPILFSGEMVRAILDGRKTQTRRVVKPQPAGGVRLSPFVPSGLEDNHGREIRPAYGVPGDRLWVREAFRIGEAWPGGSIFYGADEEWDKAAGWKPSIHMPRWASRITLEVVNVRVERSQVISHRDALAEGVSYDVSKEDGSPSSRYQILWDSINAKRGYSWDSNPWVWVIEFKRIKP